MSETKEKQPWEMTVEELVAQGDNSQEGGWYRGKQYLIPRDKFVQIGFGRAYLKKDGDYYYVMADGTIGSKLEKVLHDRKIKDGLESHRYYVEKAISQGKVVPPEVLVDYPDLDGRGKNNE